MKLLLDTCTFLWLNSDLKRIPERVRLLCADESNQLFLSAVSAWDIAVKYYVGRLRLVTNPEEEYGVLVSEGEWVADIDVSRDEEIDAVFAQVKEHYGTIYTVVHAVAFAPAGPERAWSRIEITRQGVAEQRSGITGFRLLRLNGSAFRGFVRDQYTTLPDIANRPLHMWLDLDWSGAEPVADRVRKLVHDVFDGFESGSIQQIVYQIGTKMLAEIPSVSEVNLEANNRTWDTIAEQGDSLGVYTDPRPPYGCLGLSLKR